MLSVCNWLCWLQYANGQCGIWLFPSCYFDPWHNHMATPYSLRNLITIFLTTVLCHWTLVHMNVMYVRYLCHLYFVYACVSEWKSCEWYNKGLCTIPVPRPFSQHNRNALATFVCSCHILNVSPLLRVSLQYPMVPSPFRVTQSYPRVFQLHSSCEPTVFKVCSRYFVWSYRVQSVSSIFVWPSRI